MHNLDTKEKIIDAAIRLFAEKGYHATSVQEIMDLAGVNKAMFFYYFKSKENCYNLLFENGLNELKERIVQAVQSSSELKVQLRNFIKIIVEIPDDERNHKLAMIFIREAGSSGENIQKQIQIFIQAVTPMEQAIKKGIEEGLIREVDPRLTVISIIGSVKDLALHYKLNKLMGALNKEKIIKHAMNLLLNGLLNHQEEER